MRHLAMASILFSLALSAGCQSAGKGDWQPLFNGKSFAGWTVKAKPADVAKAFWTVEDGAILADSMGHKGHDYVWLVTNEEYGDFVLKLKFQAFKDSPGNTGVQIRSRYDDAAFWLHGPQVDIHPPGPWRTGMVWDETRGNQRWLYPKVEKGKWVDESMAVPGVRIHYADQEPIWNELEITAKGTQLRAVLNGVRVMEYDGAGVLDDDLHRKLNVGMRGHIALQIHSGDQVRVRYKDIQINRLGK